MKNKGAVAVIVIAIIAVLSLGTWSKSGMKPPVEGQEQAQTQESVSAAEQSHLAPLGFKSAVIFMSVVPMVIIYPFIQRFFIKGIMIGAIKG